MAVCAAVPVMRTGFSIVPTPVFMLSSASHMLQNFLIDLVRKDLAGAPLFFQMWVAMKHSQYCIVQHCLEPALWLWSSSCRTYCIDGGIVFTHSIPSWPIDGPCGRQQWCGLRHAVKTLLQSAA